MTSTPPTQILIEALARHFGSQTKAGLRSGNGDQWSSKCPSHDDHDPSLSFGVGHNGKVVFTCHADCPSESILEVLRLSWDDLNPSKNGTPRTKTATRKTNVEPAATDGSTKRSEYEFTDTDGNPLHREVRIERSGAKTYRQERWTQWGWKTGLNETRRVPFNLPAITGHPDRTLVLVEGASNAVVAQHAADEAGLAMTFTAVVGGAGGWRYEYAVELSHVGVDRIVVIPDEDEDGQGFAQDAAADFYAVGIEVVVVPLSVGDLDPENLLDEGDDIVDWLDRYTNGYGRTPEELLTLLNEYATTVEVWTDDEDKTLELDTMLKQVVAKHDWLMHDQFERGDRLIITGGEGAGKTTLLRQIAVCAASGLHWWDTTTTCEPIDVLVVDLENSDAQVSREFRPHREFVGDQYRHGQLHVEARGEAIDLIDEEDQTWLERKVARYLPQGGLLLIGPIYKMMTGDSNSDQDIKKVTDFLDHLRLQYGLALVIEAHTRHPGQQSGTRHRPAGSRHLVRWPEFGFHLSKNGTWTGWREPRDATRRFPTRFQRGNRDIGEPMWVGVVSEEARRFQLCLDVMLRVWNPGQDIPGSRKVVGAMKADYQRRLGAAGQEATPHNVEEALKDSGITKKILEGLIDRSGTMRPEWEDAFRAIEDEATEIRNDRHIHRQGGKDSEGQ